MTSELSPRELTALCLVAHGLTDAEIAAEMCVEPVTVRSYLSHVRCKLGFPVRSRGGVYATGDKANRVKLALYALQRGYIALDDIPVIQGENNGK